MRAFPNPIFCALDMPDLNSAISLIHEIKPHIGGVKIGMEFFYATGNEGVKAIAEIGLPIFLDLKLHDIPNTVFGALKSLLPLKPAIINIHLAGGSTMMAKAREAVDDANSETLLIGVSVLTSLETADTEAQVLAFAQEAARQGLDGIVCSGKELPIIRKNISPDFLCITPGIRPQSENSHDQKRTTTPQQAIEMGADILVIGRAITAAANPSKAAKTIWEEIKPLCK